MLGSADYQEVNRKYIDTCILCTMEITYDGELAGNRECVSGEAKL